MAYKFIRRDTYLADSASDLQAIPEKDMGSTCYVLDEATEYRLMSTGEWVKQTVASSSIGTPDGNYATKEDIENAIAAIEHPTVDLSNYAIKAELDALKISQGANNDSYEMYGLKVTAAEGKSLHDTIRDLGLCGFKTLWVQKGVEDLPDEMKSGNQSGRGFFCCDYWNNKADFIAWIQLFVKDGSVYTGFINHGAKIIWKKLA